MAQAQLDFNENYSQNPNYKSECQFILNEINNGNITDINKTEEEEENISMNKSKDIFKKRKYNKKKRIFLTNYIDKKRNIYITNNIILFGYSIIYKINTWINYKIIRDILAYYGIVSYNVKFIFKSILSGDSNNVIDSDFTAFFIICFNLLNKPNLSLEQELSDIIYKLTN